MKRLILCLLVMTLTACSSKPLSLNYYVLSTPLASTSQAVTPTGVLAAQTHVLLQPVLLADYLNQSSLVMQIADHQMYFSRQDIWAERLDKAIQKTLLQDLNHSQRHQYRAYPGVNTESNPLSLTVQIDYFHATFKSTVALAGRYWITDPRTQKSVEKTFNFSQVLKQDGYSHAVQQQRELLRLLATEIQQSLDLSELTTSVSAITDANQA